ncbi:replication initiation and membrane attachment family protein [Bacillus sp. V3B]|uniref:replication initiation and membrane attachment family protein n=1 Tax=Bacillus sp. V3B TaxID=2804915 RepID=UPI00210DA78F|nr:replication initiation and membrane attachment family protein [Bacillus sp. V3B]MCQ6273445.1 replication initiation and membrane attachment family protein [Bacillus sp. V3B]
MTSHWQKLVPVDQYIVAANGLLHDYDRKILVFLYQPLIGSRCLSLYMTLWAEMEENRLWSETHSHHSLMNFMDMNLKEIYEARLKLEGMGLLKTFVKESEEHRSFVYELQPPLTPEQFLSDGMLNIYLYRKIGKTQFARVKRFFSEKAVQDSEFKQVTKAFQDVFSTAHPSMFSYDEETKQDISESENERFIGRLEPKGIKAGVSDFNFELLLAGLHESLISKDAFTNQVKEVVSSLAFLYGIDDPIQMKKIVLRAVNQDGKIDIEELRKAARDWYQLEHYDKLPSLIEKTQPAIYQTVNQEPETQEDKLIHYFETTSPLRYLRDMGGGSEPSKADVKIIEDVLFQQKLNPGVVNVLIDNVMRKTDMKLTQNYVEKIASHWARKNIRTVKEAMELAKMEHRQYAEWAEGKKTTKQSNYKKKPVRTEVLPDWFDDKEKNEKTTPSKKITSSKQGDKQDLKKQEIEAMLKKLRS